MEPLVLKDEWKFATTIDGVLSVMTHGLLMMPMWHVDNWDSEALVHNCYSYCTLLIKRAG